MQISWMRLLIKYVDQSEFTIHKICNDKFYLFCFYVCTHRKCITIVSKMLNEFKSNWELGHCILEVSRMNSLIMIAPALPSDPFEAIAVIRSIKYPNSLVDILNLLKLAFKIFRFDHL